MKQFIYIIFFISTVTIAQKSNYNIQKGAMASGYDVVAYFNNKALKGNKKIAAKYDGVTFRFATKEHLKTFKKSPKKFIPQYGGYCAYAIGKNAEKVDINPKTFEIRDGKLYLFYNAWGTNTLKMWQKEGATLLREKADINWKKLANN